MKTCVIGLGAMGGAMALNLHKAGHLYSFWNRTKSKAADICKSTGVPPAGSIAEAVAVCDAVITCVSRDEDLWAVIEEIADSIKPGTIVIDTSTVSSATAKKAAAQVTRKGGVFLDCPVTGGVEGARNGTLTIMAGGEAAVLDRVREVLSSISKQIVHIGPTGSGQACKAVNQVICAGINQAVTEGLSFGESLELDMDKVLAAVSGGAAGNWFMDHRGKTMIAGRYDAGFKLNLHHKDLEICMDMAFSATDTELPLTAMTLADYEELMSRGHGDEDISALYRLKRPAGTQGTNK